MRAAYTFTILRYVHDTTTCETLNIGVALYSPEHMFAQAMCCSRICRLKQAFPNINGKALLKVLKKIQEEFCTAGERLRCELPLTSPPENALQLAHSILPHDDSSLQ